MSEGGLFGQQRHTVRVRMRQAIRITCHTCGCEFEYTMERTAFGSAGTPEMAVRRADERAGNLLDEDVDCVPCPCCGDYQPGMVARLRRRMSRRLRTSYQNQVLSFAATTVCYAWVLLCALLVALAFRRDDPWPFIGAVAATFGIGFLVGLVVRAVVRSRERKVSRMTRDYDPNHPDEREERLTVGQAYATVIRVGSVRFVDVKAASPPTECLDRLYDRIERQREDAAAKDSRR